MPTPVTVRYGNVTMAVPAVQASSADVALPKVNYLPPTAGQSQSAWNTSGAFLDFTLPKSIGVLNNLKLRFQVANSGGSAVPAPPLPFWVQQVEVYIGGSQIEVIYPNDLFNEVVGFKTREELDTEQDYLGTTYAQNGDSPQTLEIPVRHASQFNQQQFYYLPLPNCLSTAHLYVAGVSEDVRFRVYFPPNLFPTNTISCSSCVMCIEEDCVPEADVARYEAGHRTGIVYNTIVRQRQNQTITKNGTADNTIELTGLSGASAGIMVYCAPAVVPNFGTTSADITRGNDAAPPVFTQVPTNQLLYKRFPISTSLELDDSMGAKRTEELRTEDLSTFTWFSHINTNFAERFATYLMPFSSAVRRAVEDATNQGALNLRGNDRLVIRGQPVTCSLTGTYSPSASETWNVTVTNYCCQALVFKGRMLTNVIRKISA